MRIHHRLFLILLSACFCLLGPGCSSRSGNSFSSAFGEIESCEPYVKITVYPANVKKKFWTGDPYESIDTKRLSATNLSGGGWNFCYLFSANTSFGKEHFGFRVLKWEENPEKAGTFISSWIIEAHGECWEVNDVCWDGKNNLVLGRGADWSIILTGKKRNVGI